jgi:folate-dependent phosphoribosylglycinamide formyltransferase PurN
MNNSILLLGGPGPSTRIVYNRLAGQFGAFPVIIEDGMSRSALIRNRIRKLGLRSTLSQLIFMTTIRPLLSYAARQRMREIATVSNLNDGDIPETQLRRVSSVNAAETIAALRAVSPKVIIVNGTRIIARKVLESVPAIFINTHAGITPKYRGAHGAYWALANADPDRCGVTIHIVDSGIDTGAIVAQALVAPTSKDSFVTYPYLQLAAALPLLVDAVGKALDNKLVTQPAEGESAVWYHPGVFQYLAGRARGIK